MGGAQPLAVTMNDGRLPRDRGRRGARPAPPRHRLRRPADRPTPPRPSRWAARRRPPAGPRLDRPGRQRGGDRARLGARPASVRPRHRPDLGPRRPRRLRARPRSRSPTRCAPARDPARRVRPPVDGRDGRPRPGDARVPGRRARSSSTTATTCAPRPRRPASRTRSTTRASCPPFIRPQFCEGRGPFRWVALSRRPGRHRRAPTSASSSSSPTTTVSTAGSRWPRSRCRSRACPPGSAGSATASGRGPAWPSTSSSGPARSARRSSSAATTSTRARSPHRTARRRRWPTAPTPIADWPLLNALVNTAAGATWVSIHHGGGVGIGYSPARRDGRRRRRHASSRRGSWSAS